MAMRDDFAPGEKQAVKMMAGAGPIREGKSTLSGEKCVAIIIWHTKTPYNQVMIVKVKH